MQRSIRVIFDGEVLRPEAPLDLTPNGRYIVTIQEPSATPPNAESSGALDDLLDLVTDFGVTDLAAQHDHYLYRTPKR